MKYFIIAGEHSGDIYGAMLSEALQSQDYKAQIYGIGGDKMEQANVCIIKHINDLAIMGLWQIFTKIFTLINTYFLCIKNIKNIKPDVLVLIDYGGFNLRIAKWAKKNNVKVVYYIPPKVWAWNEKRILTIKKCVDKVLLIFPFEKKLYDKYNINAEYVGNPQIEYLNKKKHIEINIKNNNIITLMPGSRKQEVVKMLPIMIAVAANFNKYQFVIIKASNLPDELYCKIINKYKTSNNLHSVRNLEFVTIKNSIAAIVKSGTSTLQVALENKPQIVCYKTSAFNYHVFKRFVKVAYISLPNLIMDKEIIPELIQHDMTEQKLVSRLQRMFLDIETKFIYNKMMENYNIMKAKLLVVNKKESPSMLAAECIIKVAK